MAAEFTEEHEHFTRSVIIILELLPLPLRKVLINEIAVTDILTKVSQSQYFKKRPLFKEQDRVLKNISTIGDYSECDTTLLYSLLRNLTDAWNNQSTSSIKTLVPYIEKIRNIRNRFGHAKSATLTEQQYHDFLKDVKEILTMMDSHLPGKKLYTVINWLHGDKI